MYLAKGGWFMTRSQIIAVVLAAGIVVVGAGYAWREGMFVHPGATSPAPAQLVATAPAAPPSSKSVQPSATQASPPAEPGQEANAPRPPQSEAAAPVTPPAAQPPTASEAAARQPAKPGPDIPVFDTVRVEPSGDTVVAGHGAPDAKFALVSGDKVLSEVEGDGAGNFVMVPPPLAPGNYLLALRSIGKDGSTLDSHQNIAVSVPPKGQKNVVVALAEPGKPSVILTDTQNKPAPAPPAGAAAVPPEVAFKTAEVDNGGFYASGTATPGAHLRVYLNGSILTDVTAGRDGHWSLTIGKGMTPGHFAVRADMIDATGKVLARAEVPFEVPVTVAEADAPRPPQAPQSPPAAAAPPGPARPTSPEANPKAQQVATAPPASSATDAVVPQIQTTTVVRGDSLWRISRKVFGHGIRYTLIYEANASQIRDPSLIYPGQVFVLPHITN
ncbi:MAG: LysM peptidoglycan-binding domain-containing protein [Methylovirgula sp.]